MKLLLSTVLFCSALTLGQNRITDLSHESCDTTEYNPVGRISKLNNAPYTGTITQEYSTKEEVYPFIDGKLNGTFKRFENKTLVYSCEYVDGSKEGKEYWNDLSRPDEHSIGYNTNNQIDSLQWFKGDKLLAKYTYDYYAPGKRFSSFYHCLDTSASLVNTYYEVIIYGIPVFSPLINNLYYGDSLETEYNFRTGKKTKETLYRFNEEKGRSIQIWTKNFNENNATPYPNANNGSTSNTTTEGSSITNSISSSSGKKNKAYKGKKFVVSGKVLDAKGNPLGGETYALIKNEGSDHLPVQEITTKDNGKFSFDILEPGSYDLKITSPGKIPFKMSIVLHMEWYDKIKNGITDIPISVSLKDTTAEVQEDYYNHVYFVLGRDGEITFTKVRRFIQPHEIKAEDGFKKPMKLVKYIAKKMETYDVSSVLALVLRDGEYQKLLASKPLEIQNRFAGYYKPRSFDDQCFSFERLQVAIEKFSQAISSSKGGFKRIKIEEDPMFIEPNGTNFYPMRVFFVHYMIDDQVRCITLELAPTITGWKLGRHISFGSCHY